MKRLRIADVNSMDRAAFVAALGAVFERSPWVAERAFAHRPFTSVDALHAAMVAAVDAASEEDRLALLRAHPRLAGRAAIASDLTPESAREQRGAGLDRCTPQQFAALCELNARYDARFDFPFILAVKGRDVEGILSALRTRVAHSQAQEMAEALRQVARIARFRLEDAFTDQPEGAYDVQTTITVIAHIRATKGKGDALAALLTEQAGVVREAEPGCLEYRPHRCVSDPDLFVFYEVYRDEAAFEVHRQASHLAAYRQRREREGLVDGTADVKVYRSLTD